ncbi:MAG: chemotaxis protein CheD [Gammaproteobacteria bacterium]
MMSPLHPVEIFLRPGDCYFGGQDTSIRTVLGSCVSMTFWHPQLRVGGMCHYMLPKRSREYTKGDLPAPDGRYADEAIVLLLNEIDVVGAAYREYQVRLFGGGNMFPKVYKNSLSQIGFQNVQAARRLVKEHGFYCIDEQLGDIWPRKVIFEVWSGHVWVKQSDLLPEAKYKSINRRLG